MKLEFETKEEGNAFWEWLMANKKRPDVMEAGIVETHKMFIREYRKGDI